MPRRFWVATVSMDENEAEETELAVDAILILCEHAGYWATHSTCGLAWEIQMSSRLKCTILTRCET